MVFSEVDPLRGRLTELARTPQTYFDWSVSPDASRIALVSNHDDKVQVLDLRSKQVSIIRPVRALTRIQRVSWSAVGTTLFLTATDGPWTSVFMTMDLRGRTHALLEGGEWFADPRPSPIAYLQSITESTVTLLDHF